MDTGATYEIETGNDSDTEDLEEFLADEMFATRPGPTPSD